MKAIRATILMTTAALLAVLVAAPGLAQGKSDEHVRVRFGAELQASQEVPSRFSDGHGAFRAQLTPDRQALDYVLSYEGLTDVLFSHIHVGQAGVNGGVAVFLCGGGGAPACPASEGEVEGTIIASDVLEIAAQGLTAEDFASLLEAMRDGYAYVNVHTASFPAGELRGQVGRGRGRF